MDCCGLTGGGQNRTRPMAHKPHKRKQSDRPKGSYPHPDGGFISTTKSVAPNGRTIHVTAVHSAEPDTALLAKALLELGRQLTDSGDVQTPPIDDDPPLHSARSQRL